MVTCKQCMTNFEFPDVLPEIDDDGLHFCCPTCGHRNVLVNVAKPGDPLLLTQMNG